MTKLIRYLSIALTATIVSISATGVKSQTFDFSVAFSGLNNIGGDGTLSALLDFDGGSLTSIDSLTFVSDGVTRSVTQIFQQSATLGGGSAGNTLSAIDLIFQINYEATTATITVDYPSFDTTTNTANSLAVSSAVSGSQLSLTSWQTSYEFGGSTVNTTTGEPDQAPVAVPEINGGRAVLMAFILATLGLAMSVRRRRAGPPHTVGTFA